MLDIEDPPTAQVASSPGNSDHVDALWRSQAPQMMRFATVLVGPSDAHDVTVEAFLRSAASVVDGRVDNPRSYLMRAVANRAHDLRRGRERQWVRDLAAVQPSALTESDPNLEVRQAVANLSLAQRSVIYFIYWEDLREHDVAEVLGISPGSVRRHLVRARAHLRKALS